MNRALKYIMAAFCLLQLSISVTCAESGIRCAEMQGETPWEDLLDRYELICRKCIELKQRQDTGEQIPSRQLLSLMDQLELLRDELKKVSDKMPASAKRRFYAIRRMYSSGKVADTKPELLPTVSEAFLPSGAENLCIAPLDTAAPISLPPRPEHPVRAISASISAPALCYGLRLDYWWKNLGAWAAMRSNFSAHSTSYNAKTDGSAGESRIWASGKSATDRFSVTAGPVIRIGKQAAVSFGAGYGYSRLCWEDHQSKWMLVEDASYKGFCYELGASVLIQPCILSLSWLSLPGISDTANLSIGFCF